MFDYFWGLQYQYLFWPLSILTELITCITPGGVRCMTGWDTRHMCWWRGTELRLGLGKVIHKAVLNVGGAYGTKFNVAS